MRKPFPNPIPVTAFALLLAGACAPEALASGFQLREQSASAQGMAFAGISAAGADISSMFFNPATLTAFEGSQVAFGASSLLPNSQMNNGVGTRPDVLTGANYPIRGTGISGNATRSGVLPAAYAMASITPDFKLGFSLNAPFGLITQYPDTFVGAGYGLKTELRTLDLGLNAAYRLSPQWSVGATLLSRHVDAELRNGVDFGQVTYMTLLKAAAQGLANPSDAAPFAPSSLGPAFNGTATVNGSQNVLSYKVGLVYQPSPEFRAGLAYQSSTNVNVKGTVAFNDPDAAPQALAGITLARQVNNLVNGSASAQLNLPDTTSLGLSWDVSPTVNLGFEADLTGWSQFKELRIKFGSGEQDDVTPLTLNNTLFCSLGASWKVTSDLTLRAGLASDQGTVGTATRTPRIPDARRFWMSVGAGYAFTQTFGMDLAYTHILVQDGAIALQAGTDPNGPNFFRGNLSGTFQSHIEVVALQAHYQF